MTSFEKLRRLLMCADQLVSASISHTDENTLEATVGLSLARGVLASFHSLKGRP